MEILHKYGRGVFICNDPYEKGNRHMAYISTFYLGRMAVLRQMSYKKTINKKREN